MLEDKLSFPQEAIEAAKAFATERWGLDNVEPKNLIGEVECGICNDFQGLSLDYGVADAILSGKRLRLFHEFPNGKMRMNCAEVGINAFLIYSAFDAAHNMVLMRYNDGQPSDHFAVLNYDLGEDEPPTILDPLWGFSGRAQFTKNGFTHTPVNLLNLQNRGLSPREFKAALAIEDDIEPRHFGKGFTTMTIDDVMRHINYINSPMGFFDYFKKGQKILEQKEGETEIEFNAKIFGEHMLVNAVCNDMLPLLFTFERRYKIGDAGEILYAERKILHAGYKWTTPTEIIFIESKEGSQILHPQGNKKYSLSELRYLREISRRKNRFFYDEISREECTKKMRSNLSEAKAKLDSKLGDPTKIYLDDETENQRHHIAKIESLLKHIDSLNPSARSRLVDFLKFHSDFPNGKKSFRGGPNPKQLLSDYLTLRYAELKPKIEIFFESQVMQCLMCQYKEAVYLKRQADATLS